MRHSLVLVSMSGLLMSACASKKVEGDWQEPVTASDTPEFSSEGVGQDYAANTSGDAQYNSGSTRQYTGGGAYRLSRFPKIAPKAFQKQGFWLNAYYFVRGEQSYEDLSTLIYGRPDRANLISKWNDGQSLSAGTVIYYNSPIRYEAAAAKDFYDMKDLGSDMGIQFETLTVKQGDTLSLIAGARYGQIDAWREIAALNRAQLSSPDLIEIGQNLKILPATLNTKSILEPFIAKLQAEARGLEAAKAELEQVDQAGEDASSLTNDTQNSNPSQAGVLPRKTAPPEQFKAVAQSEHPNMLRDLLLVGGALAILGGIGFFVVQRRRARAQAELNNLVSLNNSNTKTGTDNF